MAKAATVSSHGAFRHDTTPVSWLANVVFSVEVPAGATDDIVREVEEWEILFQEQSLDNFKPFFNWRDYLFGNSILAFCAQLVMGAFGVGATYAACRLLGWLP